MATTSTLSRDAVRRLKAATAAAIRATGPGNASALAQDLGRCARSLGYYTAHDSHLTAPADLIAEIERECGAPMITRVLADLAGFDLVARAPAKASSPAATIRESSEAIIVLTRMDGGALSAPARASAVEEITHAIEALQAMRAALTEGQP